MGHARVQRRRGGENLKGRARLVGVGDHGVAHQLRQRGHVLARRLVEVVVGLGNHGENLAGVRIHHQHAHALGVVDRQGLARGLFGVGLDGGVDGQRHRASVHGANILAGAVGDFAPLAVDLLEDVPFLAGEKVVERLLQPGLTHAVHRRQPQELTGKRAHRIVAPAVLFS